MSARQALRHNYFRELRQAEKKVKNRACRPAGLLHACLPACLDCWLDCWLARLLACFDAGLPSPSSRWLWLAQLCRLGTRLGTCHRVPGELTATPAASGCCLQNC